MSIPAGYDRFGRARLPIDSVAEQTMAMPQVRRRWTADDVRTLISPDRAWPRYELIAGELLVTPAPGPIHQLAVAELLVILNEFVDRTGVGVAFTSPADVSLRPDTIVQPDVFVVPRGSASSGDSPLVWSDVRSLLLTVEVISPSSARTDRIEKREFYLEAGVPEYWIVDLDARVIERWMPARATPVLERDAFVWTPMPHVSLTIDVPRLFDRARAKANAIRG